MVMSKQEDDLKQTGVDAHGNPIDLNEFEEGYYDPGEVDDTLKEYTDLLGESFAGTADLKEDQIVKGKILEIGDKEVFIDVNQKSEGAVPLDEFKDIDEYQVGDTVDVYIEETEDSTGTIGLSKTRADFLKVWDDIYKAWEDKTIVKGKVLKRIKGGVVVDLFGINAFLPGSQIALRQIPDMDEIIGEEFELRVIKINKARRNIVVSRRVILEEEREEKRKEILKNLKKGDVREGTVKNITDFGAFIDLGGADGLLHITDMSWGRVNHPTEIVSLGDTVKVMILDFNEDKRRISLGLKQLQEHPWKEVEEKYPEGSHVRGKIVSITDYGAFMELEKGIEGLIHISEMSWTKHVKHPTQLVGIGDIMEAIVLKVDKDSQKISLGFKQLEPDPWENIEEEFPPGTVLSGKVRNLASFGAFVELKEGVDGLVHISDMSWTKKVNHPGEVLSKGDVVEVKVLEISSENRRISLGIKQLQPDPWEELSHEFEIGKEIPESPIARVLDRGVIVNLTDEIEGFVPLKELGRDVDHPSKVYKPGDVIPTAVIEFDIEKRRIVLSVDDYFSNKDKSEKDAFIEKYPIKEEEPKEEEPKEEEPKEKEPKEKESKDESAKSTSDSAPDSEGKGDKAEKETKAPEQPEEPASSEQAEEASEEDNSETKEEDSKE